MSEVEFVNRYGPKPWDILNDILTQFGTLDYEMSTPENINREEDFRLELINKHDRKIRIDFNDLSSGEKVLMALVASVYNNAMNKVFPKLLLLDEIDATLHPSMINNLLNVLETSFIDEGTKVILATHSPTTVALAPDDSLFVMNKRGAERIEKKTKEKSLETLTEGYMTLEKGIRIFDQIVKNKLTVITEGNNISYIKTALSLFEIEGVDIIEELKSRSGKDQLKALFELFTLANHHNKVLFVLDWDAGKDWSKTEGNQTYYFVFEHNTKNEIAKKGIENLLPEKVFADFVKDYPVKDGVVRRFDEKRKNDLLEFILNRKILNDFELFKSLINKIENLLKS